MKKVILFLVALLATWQSTFAHDFSAVAPSGQTLYYTIAGSSVSVSGTSTTGDLTIPSSVTYNGITYAVTSIGNSAFNSCSGLTSVTIPNSVTSIGSYAFFSCSGLTSVTIPNSVTSIGSYAFFSCSGLTTVHFNADSCTSAGDSYYNRAFFDCHNITTFTFGSNVKIIPNYLCYDMDGLTSVTIPNSVISIGREAFINCSGLTSLTIGSSVTSIGSEAFNNCSGLTSVTIPNSVISIGREAFINCSGLTSLTIGSSVTSIGGEAFKNCSGLTSVTIPNSVTSIGDYAFSGCSGLTSVTIPNSVTFIERNAFSGCSGLTTVHFNADSCTFAGGSYSDRPFSGCHNITTFTFGNNVKIIPNYLCYDMDGLTSVTISNSVTSIGMRAFENCSGLTSVTIPNSVTSIGVGAFRECRGLLSVTLGSGVVIIGDYAFAGRTRLPSIVSKATYPPICSSSTFEGIPSYCTLTVPCGSLPYYSVQSPWDTLFPLKQEDCRTEYTLIVESADPTMGYVVGGGTALNGDTVVICAVGNPGYRFLRWQDNNTDSVRTVTVTGNATYTAYFAETVGIEDVADGEGVRVWSFDGRIHVVGAEGMDVNVYDILGRRVSGKRKVESGKLELAVPVGVYLVRIGDLPARKVVVIRS